MNNRYNIITHLIANSETPNLNYFSINNLQDYISSINVSDKDEIDAISILFDDKFDSELIRRCNKALEVFPYCFEAYFVRSMINDITSLYYSINNLMNINNMNYKNNIVDILFLLYLEYYKVHNYHECIRILDKIVEINNNKEEYLCEYILIYSLLEDCKSLYNLYKKYNFDNARSYIILIITLLKNNKESVAKQVYLDMLKRVKYAEYIDTPQELDSINNKDSRSLFDELDKCFYYIESIPYFYSWINNIKKEKFILVN